MWAERDFPLLVQGLCKYATVMENSPDLEAHIAHLQREVEDLSNIVTQQAAAITRLKQQVAVLLEREAAREAAATFDDKPPPHW